MSAHLVDPVGSDPLDRPGTVTVPAQLRFLELIRTSVRIGLGESGCDAETLRDLELASDELAAVLIDSADPTGMLRVGVVHDDEDVYVRMSVPLSEAGFRPLHEELTRMLLDATADSYDVSISGGDLVGVLQRALHGGTTDPALAAGADDEHDRFTTRYGDDADER